LSFAFAAFKVVDSNQRMLFIQPQIVPDAATVPLRLLLALQQSWPVRPSSFVGVATAQVSNQDVQLVASFPACVKLKRLVDKDEDEHHIICHT
jgi:hypothetical protein